MAILPDLPGVEVTICVDGRPLSEYLDDEDDEAVRTDSEEYRASRTVSKFVECITEKEFTIVSSVQLPYKMDCAGLNFLVEVDGRKVRTLTFRKPEYEKKTKRKQRYGKVIEGVEVAYDRATQRKTVRALVFSAVSTSSEHDRSDRIQEDAEQLDRVGMITVTVHRLKEVSVSQNPHRGVKHRFEGSSVAGVHEKALKGSAKSHGVSLGSVAQERLGTRYTTTHFDDRRPLVVFNFKYRSRDALKSLLVIPRTPSPRNDPAEFTQDQKDQVKVFKRNLLAGGSSSKIKRENPDAATSSRDKKPRLENKGKGKVVVYDLTGDSD